MSTILVRNLNFAYPGHEKIFDNASFSIDSSWKLGLIGRNGRGKTTFFKLLTGQEIGTGTIKSGLIFSYFPLNISNNSDKLTLSLLEDNLSFETWELQRELSLMNTSTDLLWRPFSSLSGGEQTKVLLAATFIQKNTFPLLDEPTNHLDITSRQQVAEYLKAKKQGFILTSHDRDFLNQVIDHTLTIERQKITLEKGNYDSYARQKKLEDKTNIIKNEKLKREISNLNKSAVQSKNWANKAEKGKSRKQKSDHANIDRGFEGKRAAKVMKKSANIQKRVTDKINEKKDLLMNIEESTILDINYQPTHHKDILTLENVSLAYQNDSPLFSPISFILRQGQQLVLQGDNGSGKTSLIKAILGQTSDYTGKIKLAANLSVSYLPQITKLPRLSLQEYAEQQALPYNEFLNILRKLGTEREVFVNTTDKLSSGQSKKVLLATSLLKPSNFYIWDEPLNYLDIFNQEQIIHLIKDYQPTMLIVEHDKRFVEELFLPTIKLIPNNHFYESI